MALLSWRRLVGLADQPTADQTKLGPDFPGSGGDRERGRFRASSYPRLTTVAVCNDDGSNVGSDAVNKLDELLQETQAMRKGLELLLSKLMDIDVNLRELARN